MAFCGLTCLVAPGQRRTQTVVRDQETCLRHLRWYEYLVVENISYSQAPIALKSAGVGLKRAITSHPSVQSQLESGNDSRTISSVSQKLLDFAYSQDRVVVDGNLITSSGPGTAYEFGLTIIKHLVGDEILQRVCDPLVLHPGVSI